MNYIETKGESVFEDIAKYDEITDEETLHELVGDPIIMDHYIGTVEQLFDRLIDIGVRCWNNRGKKGEKLQRTLIKIKTSVESEKEYQIQFNRFLINLPFLIPLIEYFDHVDLNDFLLDSFMTENRQVQLQKDVVGVLRSHGKTLTDLQRIMDNVSYGLKRVLLTFSQADMEVLTAENIFLDHYRESEIIREINNTHYDGGTQTADIVKMNAEKYKLLEAEMMKRKNMFFENNLYTKILKPKQMEECFINFSQTPDGRVIVPVIQNGNGFYWGYHDPATVYAAAIAARVPDIMNSDYMGSAGYFNRNLMILTYGTISSTVGDCGSVNKIRVVMDEVELEMKNGRFYSIDPDSDVLKVLDKNKDKDLIGKTLYFRSPCTCNLREDVCHVCYGTQAKRVGDLKGGFIYTTELMTSRISQNVLSAKHLLKSDAEPIIFSDNFDKYFTMEYSEVFPVEGKRFDIYIPVSYHDDDLSESFTFYIGKDLSPVTITNYQNIYIPDNIIDKCKKVDIGDDTYYKITSFKVIEEGGTFCNVTPINKMMTQKYLKMMKLFESELPKFTCVDDAVSSLTHMLYGLIPIKSVHGEVMISRHIRRKDNKLLRPNYLEKNPEYQMLRLQTALQNIEAVTTAYSFEKPKFHTYSQIVDERNKINRVGARGFSDYLYEEEVL